MMKYKDFIVRYRRFNKDDSITSFNAGRFDKRWKAKRFIRLCNRKKSPNEFYTIIGEKEDREIEGKVKALIEKLKQYQSEGRGDWWFYPLWKKIVYAILFPFIILWLGICWCIMKFGRGIYMFGDMLSGWSWNHKDWTEEI